MNRRYVGIRRQPRRTKVSKLARTLTQTHSTNCPGGVAFRHGQRLKRTGAASLENEQEPPGCGSGASRSELPQGVADVAGERTRACADSLAGQTSIPPLVGGPYCRELGYDFSPVLGKHGL